MKKKTTEDVSMGGEKVCLVGLCLLVLLGVYASSKFASKVDSLEQIHEAVTAEDSVNQTMNELTAKTDAEEMLDTLSKPARISRTSLEATTANSSDAELEAEEEVKVVPVPVVLSEDGTFWYDQNLGEMSLESAEEFLLEHKIYASRILYLNDNPRYLSVWESSEQMAVLEGIQSQLKFTVNDPATAASDQLVQAAAQDVVRSYNDLGTMAQLIDRLHNNIASFVVEGAQAAMRDRQIDDVDDAPDYIFWVTVAKLVDDDKYSIENINIVRRELEPPSYRVASPTDEPPKGTTTTIAGNEPNWDEMTDSEIVKYFDEQYPNRTQFDQRYSDVFFDKSGTAHCITMPVDFLYADSNGYVFQLKGGHHVNMAGDAYWLFAEGKAEYIGKTNRRIK